MKKCVFKIYGSEAHYLKEYEDGMFLEPGEVIVTFTHDNFYDIVHIDDGDIKCMQILHEEEKDPVITR